VLCDAGTARLAGLKNSVCGDAAALAREVDLLLVFGGDGTMLHVAREIAGSATPMLGVNIGGLGFLTAVPSDEMTRALARVWRGEFQIRIPRFDRSRRPLARDGGFMKPRSMTLSSAAAGSHDSSNSTSA